MTSKSNVDRKKLDRLFGRLERKLPVFAARPARWLRQPSSMWVRLPIAFLLILGGLLSILPVLGLWMVPLGLLLLAQDLPILRRPTRRMLIWLERRWAIWTRRYRESRH